MSLEPLRPDELRGHDFHSEMTTPILRASVSRMSMTLVDDL
jgi:hypothetical protein